MSQTLVNNQTISLGQTITVPIPPAPNPAWSWVQVQNASPYEVQVLGGPTSALIVASGWQETINLSGLESQISLTAGGTSSAATSTVTVIIGTSLDAAPPSGPLPASTTATVGNTVATQVETSVSGPYTISAGSGETIAVPAWAQTLIVMLQDTDGIVNVRGTLSGVTYLPWTPLSALQTGAQQAISVPMAPELDSEVSVGAFPSPGPPTTNFYAYFSSGPLVAFPPPMSYIVSATETTIGGSVDIIPSVGANSCFLVEQINLLTTSAPTTGNYAEGAVLLTPLSQDVQATVIQAAVQAGQTVSQSISPNVVTYPGTQVVLKAPAGTGSLYVQASLIYQILTS